MRQLEVREALAGKGKFHEPTNGLEPKRRRRVRDDGRLETHDEVDAWAKEQAWFPRVVFKRFDARWWIFWCNPEVR